jgi:hypothetical protein
MRASDLAARLHAKRIAGGWISRCPAHDDRLPSLSISEGRDGRTLLHCHAGCEPAAIAQALGFQLKDLFTDSLAQRSANQSLRAEDVELSLQNELERIVAEESAQTGFRIAVLARHRNAARETTERRFNIRLTREPIPWYEIEPHATDPAWMACVDAALPVAAARGNMSANELLGQTDALPRAQYATLRLARRFQRELAQDVARIGSAA